MRRPAESTQHWIAGGLLLGMALAAPVQAVDGVIEINQAKAKVGGVTPGDTPLFPVTISQPGSYRLTSNLDVTDATARPAGMASENTTAIQVTVNNVTIDLNGFTIIGPTACSGYPPSTPVTCSPTGTGRGIDTAIPGGADDTGVAVMNGVVSGFGNYGVSAGRVKNVTARSNGDQGIYGRIVTDCVAFMNSSGGIWADTVTNCLAALNGSSAGSHNGIQAWTVNASSANYNQANGIGATTVTGCTAVSNGGVGIAADTATGCTASSNTGSPQINATGVKGQNICSGAPCP